MSITTHLETVPSGDASRFKEVWGLKEEIRVETGFLRQEKDFFHDAYVESTTYLLY